MKESCACDVITVTILHHLYGYFCVLLPSSSNDIDIYLIDNPLCVGPTTAQPPTIPYNNSLLPYAMNLLHIRVCSLALLAPSYCYLRLKYQPTVLVE